MRLETALLQDKIVDLFQRGVQVEVLMGNHLGAKDTEDYRMIGGMKPKESIFSFTYKLYTDEGQVLKGANYPTLEEAMSAGVMSAEF